MSVSSFGSDMLDSPKDLIYLDGLEDPEKTTELLKSKYGGFPTVVPVIPAWLVEKLDDWFLRRDEVELLYVRPKKCIMEKTFTDRVRKAHGLSPLKRTRAKVKSDGVPPAKAAKLEPKQEAEDKKEVAEIKEEAAAAPAPSPKDEAKPVGGIKKEEVQDEMVDDIKEEKTEEVRPLEEDISSDKDEQKEELPEVKEQTAVKEEEEKEKPKEVICEEMEVTKDESVEEKKEEQNKEAMEDNEVVMEKELQKEEEPEFKDHTSAPEEKQDPEGEEDDSFFGFDPKETVRDANANHLTPSVLLDRARKAYGDGGTVIPDLLEHLEVQEVEDGGGEAVSGLLAGKQQFTVKLPGVFMEGAAAAGEGDQGAMENGGSSAGEEQSSIFGGNVENGIFVCYRFKQHRWCKGGQKGPQDLKCEKHARYAICF